MFAAAVCVLCSVINGIQTSDIRNLFNPENIFISKEGGGAGNNWASGFTQGEQVQETLLDMIGECLRRTREGEEEQQEEDRSMLTHTQPASQQASATLVTPVTAITASVCLPLCLPVPCAPLTRP